MSEAILTTAGRDLFAAKQGAGQTLVIDRFLLANIPALDVSAPANPLEALPVVGDRVAELAVTTSGYVDPDKVVYSLYLGTQAGDYTFNWVGLLADDDTLVAVRYIDPIEKYATSGQDLGNAITRNFLIAYTDAQTITNITIDAATWQLAFDDASEAKKGLIEIATQAEVDAGVDDTRALTPKKLAAWSSRENLLINGGFDVWQRGAQFLGSAAQDKYTADRWTSAWSFTPTALNVSQTSNASVPSVKSEFSYALSFAQEARLTTDICFFQTKLELSKIRNIISNKSVTLGFDASHINTQAMGVYLSLITDNGAVETLIQGQNFTLNTTWTRFNLTFDIPDLSGFTIGVNDSLGIRFVMFAGTARSVEEKCGLSEIVWTGDNIAITDVRLEVGSVAAPYQPRFGSELKLCQWYYRNDVRQISAVYEPAFAQNRAGIVFDAMRVVPMMTLGGWISIGHSNWNGNGSVLVGGTSGGFAYLTHLDTAYRTNGVIAQVTYTADAEL